MLSTQEFNGQRLKEARLYRGDTLEDLKKKLNISKQMISKYEQGVSIPTPEILFGIIKNLDFPREYFFSSNIQQFHYGNSYFRSLLSTPEKGKKYQLSRIENIVILRNYLEKTIEFPINTLPDLSDFESFDEKATNLRKAWDLGQNPITNAVDLLESKGFVISDLSLSSSKIDAFSQRITIELDNIRASYYAIILGSNKKSFYRRQFDAIHELSHFLLHEAVDDINDIDNDSYKKMKKEADHLAGCILLPKNAFLNDISKSPLDLNYYRTLKVKWNVSISAMIVRAKQLNVISPNDATRLFKNISKRGWRKEEPLDNITPVASPISFKEAFELLFENDIYTPRSFFYDFSEYSHKYWNYSEVEKLLNLEEGFFSKYIPNTSNLVNLKIGSKKF